MIKIQMKEPDFIIRLFYLYFRIKKQAYFPDDLEGKIIAVICSYGILIYLKLYIHEMVLARSFI